MKFALGRSARPSAPSKPFPLISFADPALQLLSFDIVAKTPGAAPLPPANPTSSPRPLADRFPLSSDHSFQVKSFVSHSYEKTPGTGVASLPEAGTYKPLSEKWAG